MGNRTEAEPQQDEYNEYPFDRMEVRVLFIAMYSIVFLVCVLGNLLVLAVVALSPRMRSITNFFLANLAAADLCVGVFCIYQNLSIYLAQSWVLGRTACKLYHGAHNLSYTASVLILVVVGAERYLAVVHPLSCRALLTPLRLRLAVGAAWLGAAALSAPRLAWAQTLAVPLPPPASQEVLCIADRHRYDQLSWDLAVFLLLYLAPLLALAALYSRIVTALWGSLSLGLSLGGRASRQPHRAAAVRLAVAVVGVFAVCHLPLHARRLWQHWSPQYEGPSSFSALFTPLTFLLVYANSAANPVLYALLSRKFRSALRDALSCAAGRSAWGSRGCRGAGPGAGEGRAPSLTATTELQPLEPPEPLEPLELELDIRPPART